MCREWTVTLPATGRVVATGRAEIEAFLARSFTDAGAVVDDAVLVGSELITNAVRAGAPALRVHLDVHADEVVVGVHDDVPTRPVLLTDVTPTDTAGRGLAIVARLGSEWGVDDDPPGKRVWVRLPVPDGTPARFNCARVPS